MSIGVETFDDAVLTLLQKGATVQDNINCLEVCREVGIKTRVLMMIGTPGQTPETIRKNKEALLTVPYDIVACTTFVPLPGSQIWRYPRQFNIRILSKNLDDYNFYFFGPQGENDYVQIISPRDRDPDEFHQETIDFRRWLITTAKVNTG